MSIDQPQQFQDEPSDSDSSVIYLIRHGDRFDYANPTWSSIAQTTGNNITDPPLSPLGHRQAHETAAVFANLKVSAILVSPYLRVLQTAAPIADTLGISLNIENGLSEAHAAPQSLPTPHQRFGYFHQIDPHYQSLVEIHPTPGIQCSRLKIPCEAFAGDYVKRIERLALQLEETYRGKSVVCVSHAASVALVAALLKSSIRGFKFAPTGIYRLRRVADGPWELVQSGDTNEHVSENAATTYPWGFEERHFEETEGNGGGHYSGKAQGIGLEYFTKS
eukprot:CAMPEP_0194444844 /NCGR_PEP_ID=MMETSP0176-20130528/127515_1 /TAXON_ID=216777 /ORGANISM="Proboscia alata, Strain PI-D3" /LENGTH=276 /DNA_ID=CAMNT_0039271303 /DNA_START=43 /DNA_END=873 /DNA_ORIENTATION=+